jgi:hypothetical protein
MQRPYRFADRGPRRLPIASPNVAYTRDNPAISERRAEDTHRSLEQRRNDDIRRANDEEARRRQIDEIAAQTILETINPQGSSAATPSITPGQGNMIPPNVDRFPPQIDQPRPSAGGTPVPGREMNIALARRLAQAGIGGPAIDTLNSIYSEDRRGADQKDRQYDEVLRIAGEGDSERAKALASRYGIQIPQGLLENGKVARAMAMASQLYGPGSADQAGRYVNEVIANNGDWEAAYRKVGPPRPKPAAPRGSVKYSDQGAPFWLPDGGGNAVPIGVPDGVTFSGGRAGQTDPALSRSRFSDVADREAQAMTNAALGPRPDPEYGDAAAIQQWDQTYWRAYQQKMQELAGGGETGPAPAPAAPSIIPDMSGAMSATPPPPEAVQELLDNPSPNAIGEFDEVFGPGAAEQALRDAGRLEERD